MRTPIVGSVGAVLFAGCTNNVAQSAVALQSNDHPVPVQIVNAAEDRTAKRLAALVMNEFRGDRRFTFAPAHTNVVTVSLAARVGWERRFDWTEIKYQVRFSSATEEPLTIVVSCWNWDLKSCARQIADSAARYK